MLGHTDVVPADATGWTEPLFSGLVKDGYVWGRGDLVFAATADEETGDHCGAKWLLDNVPDLVRADFGINDGGFEMLRIGDRRLYSIYAGEKGYAACRIVVRGRAGHGSMPQHRGS